MVLIKGEQQQDDRFRSKRRRRTNGLGPIWQATISLSLFYLVAHFIMSALLLHSRSNGKARVANWADVDALLSSMDSHLAQWQQVISSQQQPIANSMATPITTTTNWGSSAPFLLFAEAKGVAGLGKAGGDGSAGTDKSGQQVPPEVYNALTYAAIAFLMTLSVPVILYGLNELFNKLQVCLGCRDPSTSRRQQRRSKLNNNNANNKAYNNEDRSANKAPISTISTTINANNKPIKSIFVPMNHHNNNPNHNNTNNRTTHQKPTKRAKGHLLDQLHNKRGDSMSDNNDNSKAHSSTTNSSSIGSNSITQRQQGIANQMHASHQPKLLDVELDSQSIHDQLRLTMMQERLEYQDKLLQKFNSKQQHSLQKQEHIDYGPNQTPVSLKTSGDSHHHIGNDGHSKKQDNLIKSAQHQGDDSITWLNEKKHPAEHSNSWSETGIPIRYPGSSQQTCHLTDQMRTPNNFLQTTRPEFRAHEQIQYIS